VLDYAGRLERRGKRIIERGAPLGKVVADGSGPRPKCALGIRHTETDTRISAYLQIEDGRPTADQDFSRKLPVRHSRLSLGSPLSTHEAPTVSPCLLDCSAPLRRRSGQRPRNASATAITSVSSSRSTAEQARQCDEPGWGDIHHQVFSSRSLAKISKRLIPLSQGHTTDWGASAALPAPNQCRRTQVQI
jgi:hypothetical protein